MMSIIFINREEELRFLNDLYVKKGPKLVIIYGRRRLGKTELLKKFIDGKKGLYFLADERGTVENARRFREQLEVKLGIPPLRAEDFDTLFRQIAERGKDYVVAIDEFTYLIEKDASIVSVFQLIFDEILKETDVLLILSGSYVSMMETEVLAYRSPLYGRRSGQIKVERFQIKDLAKFLPSYSFEDVIRTYSILDAIPGYLKFFDSKKSIIQNLKDTVFDKEQMLYLEPEILLKEELKNPTNYFNILEAISMGKTKSVEIANSSGVPFQDLPKYLNILINLGFVSKVYPVTIKKEKSKKTRYRISDNFLRFWFKFVLPNKSAIEFGEVDSLLKRIGSELDHFVSFGFESVCEKAIRKMDAHGTLGFKIERIGNEWGKVPFLKETYEIDVVALNGNSRDILFAECKWSERVDPQRLLEDLRKKAGYVDWNKGDRKEHYLLFARSFKNRIREKDVTLFDLSDLQKILLK